MPMIAYFNFTQATMQPPFILYFINTLNLGKGISVIFKIKKKTKFRSKKDTK
jgi:hypothetical protein